MAPVDDGDEKLTLLQNLKKNVLSNPFIWGLALTYFCVYIVRQAVTSWSIFYLIKEKGVVDAGAAALRVSGLEVGGLVGSLVAGRISDYAIAQGGPGGAVGKRVKVVMVYLVGVAVTLLAFKASPPGVAWIQTLCVFMIGFFLYGPQMLIGAVGRNWPAMRVVGFQRQCKRLKHFNHFRVSSRADSHSPAPSTCLRPRALRGGDCRPPQRGCFRGVSGANLMRRLGLPLGSGAIPLLPPPSSLSCLLSSPISHPSLPLSSPLPSGMGCVPRCGERRGAPVSPRPEVRLGCLLHHTRGRLRHRAAAARAHLQREVLRAKGGGGGRKIGISRAGVLKVGQLLGGDTRGKGEAGQETRRCCSNSAEEGEWRSGGGGDRGSSFIIAPPPQQQSPQHPPPPPRRARS